MNQRVLELVRRSRRRFVFNRLLAALIEIVVFAGLCVIGLVAWGSWLGWGGLGYGLCAGLLMCVCGCYVYHRVDQGTSLKAVASLLDRQFGLCDRISSSLAFARCPEPSAFMIAHMKETAQLLERQEQPLLRVCCPAQIRLLILFIFVFCLSLPPHPLPLTQDFGQAEVQPDSPKPFDSANAGNTLHKKNTSLSALVRQKHMITQVEKAVLASHQLLTAEDRLFDPVKQEQHRSRSNASVVDQDQGGPQERDAKGEKTNLMAGEGYQAVGKFDGFPPQAYLQTFAEMDASLFDSSPTAKAMQTLSNQVNGFADSLANFGFFDSHKAMGALGSARQPGTQGVDPAEHNSFTRHLGSLHHKSFSEFLKRYAAHLGKKALLRSRAESSPKSAPGSGKKGLNPSGPVPQDARLQQQATAQAVAQAAQANQLGNPTQNSTNPSSTGVPSQLAPKHAQPVHGRGTQVGGRGAGVGASDTGVNAPPKLPRSLGGEYLPLEGKLSDGKSVVQLIDARSQQIDLVQHRATSQGLTYQQVYRYYATGAQAELNSERVPFLMRDYVRAYFCSIRPVEKQDP